MADLQTEIIEKGNRLIQLRHSPGYMDLVRRSLELVKQASDTLIEFPGWDPIQIAALKARAQAAKEFHSLLFGYVEEAIQLSQQQAVERLSTDPDRTQNSRDDAQAADDLREQFFAKVDADGRIPGSY